MSKLKMKAQIKELHRMATLNQLFTEKSIEMFGKINSDLDKTMKEISKIYKIIGELDENNKKNGGTNG